MSESCDYVGSRQELERQGWKQASVTGGDHLQRTLQMYQELGFEVHLEELNPKDCGHCAICYESGNEKMYRVYTRPGK